MNINGVNHGAEWYKIVMVKNINIHVQLDTKAMCNALSSALKKKDKNLKVVLKFSPLKALSGHSLCWYCYTSLCMEESNAAVCEILHY